VVNDRINYKHRREDDEQRVQPNSKTNYKHLSIDELKTRTKNSKTAEINLRRRIDYLEKQKAVFMANLKAYDDEISFNGSKSDEEIPQDSPSLPTDEVIPDQHKTFIEELNQILSSVVQNKKQYQVALRDSLLALLKMGVIAEGKGSDYEFQEEDVTDMVDAVMEQITNQAKKLNGKDKQCRFSPKTIQLSFALWSRSGAAYRELKSFSPEILPSVRLLQNIKQQNKVRDGRDIKVYQLRAASRGTHRKPEYGFLMVDEMKLKHGVLWNSQTGEAVGLADDMLDLQSIMKRLFSKEGDVVKPAVYVNQWRYISINAGKPEGWMCGFFFNDGSLTGDTILRQFDHVVVACESINSRVYGVVLDAGGSNGKFGSRLRGNKRLSDTATWSKRRIYLWFCLTHLLKAMRNQLLASRPGGSKGFLDENGIEFGWPFIVELYSKLTKSNTRMSKENVRLDEQSANPDGYRKMDVSLAKIPFELKTLNYAQRCLCEEANITKDEMESSVAVAIVGNPPLQFGRDTHNPNLKHGHMLEKALWLKRRIFALDKTESSQAPDEIVADEIQFDDSQEEDDWDDDTELLEFMRNYSFEEGSSSMNESALTTSASTCTGSVPNAPIKSTPFDIATQSTSVPPAIVPEPNHAMPSELPLAQSVSKLKSDACALVYMSLINSIFHDMLLNKEERVNKKNHKEYLIFLQKAMAHFAPMKIAQLKRRKEGDTDWKRQFIDPTTWKNLRLSLSGFLFFAMYMLDELDGKIDGFSFIPMLFGNQSALESQFSAARGSNHDHGHDYGSHIANKSQKQCNAAIATNRMYTSDDIADSKDTFVIGSTVMKKYTKSADEKLSCWISKFDTSDRAKGTNTIDEIFESTKLNTLAMKMNANTETHNFAHLLIESTVFHQWFLLSVDDKERMAWFDSFLIVDRDALDRLCRALLGKLFSLMETALTGKKDDSMENLFRNYLICGEDFEELYTQDFVSIGLSSNRMCGIYFVETIKTIFDKCLYDSVSQLVPKSSGESTIVEIDTKDTLFVSTMQTMIGGGISKAKNKFKPKTKDTSHEQNGNGTHSSITLLFERLFFHHDVKTSMQPEYKEFYPREIEFANLGALHLVSQEFIPWAIELFKFIALGYRPENILMNRREYIVKHLAKLKKETFLYDQFRQVVTSLGITVNAQVLEAVHTRIAEYSFRAYTKQINNEDFNKIKTLASDKTNLAFRIQVQVGGHDGVKDTKKLSPTNAIISEQANTNIASELGVKLSGTVRKSKEQKIKEYKAPYDSAIAKLKKQLEIDKRKDPNATIDPEKTNLSRKECAAVLTLGFGKYTSETASKVNEMRKAVQAKLKEHNDNPEVAFWKDMNSNETQTANEKTE
jgi:hypothetical protein